MKNQYFGDINDYVKYGLLRALSGYGELPTVVCWMLTTNDPRSDGRRIQYLELPEKWRSFDPDVYDCLREQVIDRELRDVSALENSGIMRSFRFYSAMLQEDSASRKEYMQKLLEFARSSTLVFFDPDNGMEIKSTAPGSKGSSRYLYWSEVATVFSDGYSLLIYQHLPPKPRQPFILMLAQQFINTTRANCLYSYCTSHVVFFLVPQLKDHWLFAEANKKIEKAWGAEIKISKYLAEERS